MLRMLYSCSHVATVGVKGLWLIVNTLLTCHVIKAVTVEMPLYDSSAWYSSLIGYSKQVK